MRLLVCGGAGMLGQDLTKAAGMATHEVVSFSREHLDVTDAEAVRAAIAGARPDVVVNCAAYTNVDGAEEEPEAATKVNGEAAGIVSAEAARAGAAVVYPSTDYVFDGSKLDPYVESDPVGPVSEYGRSKLAGERATAEANPSHYVVRTSWLFGTGGRNFVETMLGLARDRDEVRVVRDQVGCPTYTGHLAWGILALAESGVHGVHHMAAEGECSWAELASAAFEGTGTECTVTPVTSDEFPRPARRPAYSVLRSERDAAPELPDWREGLRDYLRERVAA